MSEVVIDTDPVPAELQDGDIVVEVGAYEGAWVLKVHKQGNYAIHAYEPAARAYKMALDKLVGQNVALYPVALGDHNGMMTLYDCMRDGANTFGQGEGEPHETTGVVDVAQEMKMLGDVALMHLNAEGGELDVLERLMDTGLIKQVKMIMTQWHPYGAETSKRIESVIERLAETHEQDNIYYAWNFWRRKDDDDEAHAL